ncbi:gp30 [Burkholderia phage BcepC6B]|uniref:Gp30 n=1 Tax=Burkholderia phage BcepC6B TaxID=2883949 RepID=Q6J1P7_9CAUD|nr:endonuclease [Burkholderia phage BcepC6B]AAT38389.1 gp30 [Burkholderia phage BcepC6B]
MVPVWPIPAGSKETIMLEKTVETYLVDRVRAAGGDAYKFSSPARVSVPDRIVIFPPARVYFVELKRPGNKPTKGQLREHERLRALGCDVRVIDSREAVDAFVLEANAAPAQTPTTGFQQQVATTLRALGVPMMLVSGEAPLAKLRALLKTAETRGADAAHSPMLLDDQSACEVLQVAALFLTTNQTVTHAPVNGMQRDRTWVAQRLLDHADAVKWIREETPADDAIRPEPAAARAIPSSVIFSLECTAAWLENGCDPKAAAYEIRLNLEKLRTVPEGAKS